MEVSSSAISRSCGIASMLCSVATKVCSMTTELCKRSLRHRRSTSEVCKRALQSSATARHIRRLPHKVRVLWSLCTSLFFWATSSSSLQLTNPLLDLCGGYQAKPVRNIPRDLVVWLRYHDGQLLLIRVRLISFGCCFYCVQVGLQAVRPKHQEARSWSQETRVGVEQD